MRLIDVELWHELATNLQPSRKERRMRLIDADALMEELLKWNTEAVRTDNHINAIFSSGMIGIVRMCPTVDAEPVRHGHWVSIDDEPGEVLECDACGYDVCGYIYETDSKLYNYCPNCGAKMDEHETD